MSEAETLSPSACSVGAAASEHVVESHPFSAPVMGLCEMSVVERGPPSQCRRSSEGLLD